MQRSLSHQKPLTPFVYIVLFVLYTSLSSVYLFLPPMLAVLFVLYSKALDKNELLLIVLISFCFMLFEANQGYFLFSTILYFSLVYKFIMPKLAQNFSCKFCLKVSYVLLSYIGLYLFLTLISKVFLLPSPEINYYIVYYIVIEFFLVSLL